MHKKIIAALGMAGFIMLSYAKVNYAMDYGVTEALADVTSQCDEETAEAKLVQNDTNLVMSALTASEDETEKEDHNAAACTEAEAAIQSVSAPVVQETLEEETQPSKSQTNTAYLNSLELPGYDAAGTASARVFNVSQTEYDVLLRIVEAEATGRDVLAKMLVGNVILNRINNPAFPGTIEGVVFQNDGTRSQFSPIDDGRYYSVAINEETVEAVNRVLAGEDYSMGALYFAATGVVDGRGCWASRHCEELFRYGGHVFFAE